MKFDIVIVLASGILEDGELTEGSKRRVERGVELWRNHEAPMLLMSGKWSYALPYTPLATEAKAMMRYAILLGAPKENILLDEESVDTLGTPYYTKIHFGIPKKWKNICVVTSTFHIPRTTFYFNRVYGPQYTLSFIEAESGHRKDALPELMREEKERLQFAKKWLKDIEDGDHEAIYKKMITDHPGYAKNPTYTEEQWLNRTHHSLS